MNVHTVKARSFIILIGLVWGSIMSVCIIPMIVAKVYDKITKPQYSWLRSIFIAQDYLVNALCSGHHDTTISSQLGKLKLMGSTTGAVASDFVDWLFFVADGQENHCFNAMEGNDIYLFKPPVALLGISCFILNIYVLFKLLLTVS